MKKIHQHDEELQKLRGIVTELEPVLEQARKEKSAEILKQRQAAAERISELEKERDALVSLREEISKLEIKAREKDSERLKAVAELSKARSSYAGRNSGLEAQIGRLRGELMETCDPRLLQAEEFFRTKLEWLRTPGRISMQRSGLIEKNIFSGKVKSEISSNFHVVHGALRYCQECLKTLERLKLEPGVDDAKIQKLKDDLPDVDTFSTVEEERAMAGSRGVNPSLMDPTASEMEWRSDQIMEKARKLLRR